MSYRNPFVTSLLYRTTAEERDAIATALEQQFGAPIHVHNGYVCGVHSRAHPGALVMEELEQLGDILRAAHVHTSFSIAFAGEQPEDRLVWFYDPSVTIR